MFLKIKFSFSTFFSPPGQNIILGFIHATGKELTTQAKTKGYLHKSCFFLLYAFLNRVKKKKSIYVHMYAAQLQFCASKRDPFYSAARSCQKTPKR